MEFLTFLKSEIIYKPEDITTVLNMIECEWITNNKSITYLNMPLSFDIETSSFFHSRGKDGEKVAIMYEWTLGVNGLVIIGREWSEFIKCVDSIVKHFGTHKKKRVIIYVHNLSYEFQFMRKWFLWEKVFAISDRKPIYALTTNGIEFRCSYLLSGYSLAKLGDELQTYKCKKLVGALDYDLIRHSDTPLTEKELAYCVNDVKVVMCYVKEQIEQCGDITRIPYTKTGFVRNFCRQSCFYEKGVSRKKSFKRKRYADMMAGLRLTADEYKQLKRAFQGGFTHANPFYSNKILTDVSSYDFTSSYPSVMVSELFPMSSSEVVEIRTREQFNHSLKYYCCLFDVEFEGLQSQIYYDNYISISHCWGVEKAVTNNGRVVSASRLYTTLTEQDFAIIAKFYKWNKMKIGTFRRYKKGYLPTDFIRAILKLYSGKTTLKGVEGKEIEYLKSKEMLNSCFGMSVTDIARESYGYTTEWEHTTPDIQKEIEKYNNDSSRFLFYPWGVWVTAYARRNLFTGIVEFADDYVYSDTDSIKGMNAEKHAEYIERYNDNIRKKLYKAMDFHGLSYDLIEPKTIKGIKKCLGVWDYEGVYSRFKTLGAKRYMTENDGEISLTVSGLNKKVAIPYLIKKYGNKVFENFTNNLYIPAGFTGKNTHTYIDEERNGIVVDYKGISREYHELSAVHLMPADYSLSLSREYIDYIFSLECFT